MPGRGNINRKDDVILKTTRWAMDLLFDTCWDYTQRGLHKEFVTGNNDADGVYLLFWVRKNFADRIEGEGRGRREGPLVDLRNSKRICARNWHSGAATPRA